jgi:hypothetical protein
MPTFFFFDNFVLVAFLIYDNKSVFADESFCLTVRSFFIYDNQSVAFADESFCLTVCLCGGMIFFPPTVVQNLCIYTWLKNELCSSNFL